MTTTEISSERLEEMLAYTPTYDEDRETRVWYRDLRLAITELRDRRAAGGWRTMDSAPLNGKHCILSVPEPDGFIYSVQGAYQDGQWNAVHRDNVKPLYWMPNVLHPSPDTGKSQDKDGTWSDGGKEWTPDEVSFKAGWDKAKQLLKPQDLDGFDEAAVRLAELESVLRSVSDRASMTADQNYYRIPASVIDQIDAALSKP